jgi:hypothetical protein
MNSMLVVEKLHIRWQYLKVSRITKKVIICSALTGKYNTSTVNNLTKHHNFLVVPLQTQC